VPWRIRDDPINYLTDDQRQNLLASVLTIPDHSLQHRAAAALLLTFGIKPTAIVGLTVADVTRNNGRTFLRIGRRPLVMPGALGELIDQLADDAPEHRHTILAPSDEPNQWLFPGTVTGRAADPGRLATVLNKKFGLPTRHARNTAISALALDIPSPVLAGLLGIEIGTAIRWTKLVKRDWGDYLAHRAARRNPLGPGSH
jgi:integrase